MVLMLGKAGRDSRYYATALSPLMNSTQGIPMKNIPMDRRYVKQILAQSLLALGAIWAIDALAQLVL